MTTILKEKTNLIAWSNVPKSNQAPRKVFVGDKAIKFGLAKEHLTEIQRDSKFVFYSIPADKVELELESEDSKAA